MKKTFKYLLFSLLAILTVFPTVKAGEAEKQGDKLLKIVVLSRHGVRSPTQHKAMLDQWTNKTWPRWPVKRGYLTKRGSELVTAQWKAYRPVLAGQGLLPPNSCPSKSDYSLIADKDQRTLETAIAIFEGLAPGCAIKPQSNEEYNTLFHPSGSDLPELKTDKVLAELKQRIDQLNDDPAAVAALNRIQEITNCCGPVLCKKAVPEKSCTLTELPTQTSFNPDKNKLETDGKWPIASSIAEIMLMEYAQWPDRNAGWGLVDESVLQEIVPLHDKVLAAVNRTPAVAKSRGLQLLKSIDDALVSKNTPPLVFFVGHEANIVSVGGLLGLNWTVPEQGNNPTPPGGFLTFELWQTADGNREVRINYHAPTFASLHNRRASVVKPVQVPASPGVFKPEIFSQKVREVSRQ